MNTHRINYLEVKIYKKKIVSPKVKKKNYNKNISKHFI